MAFTVQKRELTLENPFLYWKGFFVFRKLMVNFILMKSKVDHDVWMNDLQFYVLFNSISVISGR